jgi:hypothetical protein
MSGYPSTKNLASHPRQVNGFLCWKGLRSEKETAGPSTKLPRISCGTWWRWCTSCAFPLQKGAHEALSIAA